MPHKQPEIVLRLGSHAEKEYFEQFGPFLDGLMFGGNLLESTPGATTSLLFALRAKRKNPLPYYLDPMTYCFGSYLDPETGTRTLDLDALKSEQKIERGSNETVWRVKDTYSSLAAGLGPQFEEAVGDGLECTTVNFDQADKVAFCKGVLDYQKEKLSSILQDDPFMGAAFGNDCRPAALFSPYFFIDREDSIRSLNVFLNLVKTSVQIEKQIPVHAVVCACRTLLSDQIFIESLIGGLTQTACGGVWIWFDGLDEFDASVGELTALRILAEKLSPSMKVYNLHGGYFSLLMSHDGMTGISHGVGYGERKDVEQVIGPAAPTVRYYLNPIAKRVSVAEVQRCFQPMGIKSADDFFSQVCECAVCKGVIGSDLRRFAQFGTMHRANSDSQRDTQTPEAAKFCRLHFLLNRLSERKEVARLAKNDRATHIRRRTTGWRDCAALQVHLSPPRTEGYLERWQAAISAGLG